MSLISESEYRSYMFLYRFLDVRNDVQQTSVELFSCSLQSLISGQETDGRLQVSPARALQTDNLPLPYASLESKILANDIVS